MNFTNNTKRFQYFERSQWHDLQPATSASLLSQHGSGATSGNFTFRGTNYSVNFVNWTQTNCTTSYQRNIRITGGGSGGSGGAGNNSPSTNATWEWSEGHRWTAYDAATCSTLTSAQTNGQTAQAGQRSREPHLVETHEKCY